MTLNGKTALVTGASRGIGREIARRLAREGALVAVHYGTNYEAALETVREIGNAGGAAFPVGADIGTIEGIQALFRTLDTELVARTGDTKLDVLVNNAAIAPFAAIEETSEEVFDRVFAVNAKGPFFVTQQALPRLRNGGRIINVSTAATRLGVPMAAAYAASKAAVDTLTRLLAVHLGPRGITVNAVAPGVTDTDMAAPLLADAEATRSMVGQTALGRIGRPDDIAGVVAFLASPDAGWVTGHYLEASGGLRI